LVENAVRIADGHDAAGKLALRDGFANQTVDAVAKLDEAVSNASADLRRAGERQKKQDQPRVGHARRMRAAVCAERTHIPTIASSPSGISSNRSPSWVAFQARHRRTTSNT
jgi:hypothetical protein